VRGLETKEEKGKCLKKAGMIGFLGQVIPRTHHEIAFQETVRSKLHPRRYINDLPRPYREIISDLPEPLRPPFDADISATLKRSSRAELQPADALSSTQNDAQPETSPPTPPPTPDPPAKIPDLSRFYPNDPTLEPTSTPITDSLPPSARTILARQAQDIPACTADSSPLVPASATHVMTRAAHLMPINPPRVTHFIRAPYLFLRMARRGANVVYGRCGIVAPECRKTEDLRRDFHGNESPKAPLY
jgi:hypothetical protein